jgi:hypothetical protein
MIAAMRHGLGRRAGLFYVPKPLLKAALRAAGQSESYAPLFGSLVADPSALARLAWVPPVATQEGLAALLRDAPSA